MLPVRKQALSIRHRRNLFVRTYCLSRSPATTLRVPCAKRHYYTREALGEVAPRIADFAEREGLHAHAKSVTIRYEK